jgi:tetratricopeptide (TPR) repeat protein
MIFRLIYIYSGWTISWKDMDKYYKVIYLIEISHNHDINSLSFPASCADTNLTNNDRAILSIKFKKTTVMKQSKNKRLKPLKNIDLIAWSQFIKFFVWLFGPLCIVTLFYFGIKGIVISFVVSIVITPVVMFVLDKFSGGTSSLIYGGGQGTWNQREQLAGDLNTVKYYKMRKEYDQALKAVNNILKRDPEFTEALFIKAQILWEGFENSATAKANLKKIIGIKKDKDEPIYRWASNLYDELTETERNKEPDLESNKTYELSC